MVRLVVTYIDGPFDGHTVERKALGIEPDLSCEDPRTSTWHHYALAQLPEIVDEPVSLTYRHVTEYDPATDYLDEVASVRASQLPR
jgi:hypothetical protein